MTIPYALPEGETASADYTLLLGGVPTEAQVCRVSKEPYNTVWPGRQRPESQTELASFISFESSSDGAVPTLEAQCAWDFDDFAVRPLSKRVRCERDGRKIRMFFPGPGQYTLEPGGEHRALHIFINPARSFDLRMEDPNLIYFGPGVHHPGRIPLWNGATLYIDREAVVYGYIEEKGLSNIRVCGYGVLDNSLELRLDKGGSHTCMRLAACRNVTVEGVVFRDACEWTVRVDGSQNLLFDNVKLIGMWRYNSDGIDLCNCQNAVIQNSFLRNFDDCVVLKGLPGYGALNVENILVQRCVIWCDWGRALEIGAETCAPAFRNIRFSDCDVIHATHMAMDIQNSGFAEVSDVLFENIRVEYSVHTQTPVYQKDMTLPYPIAERTHVPYLLYAETHSYYRNRLAPERPLGRNRRVTFSDISVTADPGLSMPPSLFKGEAPESDTRDICIQNVTFNGERIDSLEAANVGCGPNAGDISLE